MGGKWWTRVVHTRGLCPPLRQVRRAQFYCGYRDGFETLFPKTFCPIHMELFIFGPHKTLCHGKGSFGNATRVDCYSVSVNFLNHTWEPLKTVHRALGESAYCSVCATYCATQENKVFLWKGPTWILTESMWTYVCTQVYNNSVVVIPACSFLIWKTVLWCTFKNNFYVENCK